MPTVALWSFLFSEGWALHLWKIRHFPSIWQSRRIPHNRLIIGLLALGSLAALGGGTVPFLTAAQTPPESNPAEGKIAPPDPAAAAAGLDYLRKAHEALVQHTSIQANLVEQVAIGDRRFQIEGNYVGAGLKLRLEFKVQIAGGASGGLLEVCDGDVLWSRLDLPDSRRVTRRDVRQILKAVTTSKSVPDSVLLAELGLGGLPALLSSLERTMTFTQLREETVNDRPLVVLRGVWRPEFSARWPRDGKGQLPTYVPDEVRVYFDRETQFPARLLYLKQAADGKGLGPLVSLEFRDVVLGGPVKEQQFLFVPPDDVAPQDITRQYLDQIQQANTPAAAKPPGK